MEREELLEQVNAELGDTHLTLSERTINEELDDVLADFGEDEETNKKMVARIANRLKRMDGNLHADVSQQVKDYKKKLKTKPVSKSKVNEEEDDDDNNGVQAQLKALMERFDAAEQERKAERDERKKKDLANSVKNGLKSKFKDAGMEVNEFFLDTAMQKVELKADASVQVLVDELEKKYNADMKAAGVENSAPMFGNNGTGGKTNKTVDDFFARKGKKEGWKKD